MKKNYFLLALIIISMVAGAIVFKMWYAPYSAPSGAEIITLEVADTEGAREQGLSGRAMLPQHAGMLFVFPEPMKAGIWMKDMQFPLDIIWLNKNYTVMYYAENALPSSFPKVFQPDGLASYVIEVNTGFIKAQHIEVGTHLDIEKKVDGSAILKL